MPPHRYKNENDLFRKIAQARWGGYVAANTVAVGKGKNNAGATLPNAELKRTVACALAVWRGADPHAPPTDALCLGPRGAGDKKKVTITRGGEGGRGGRGRTAGMRIHGSRTKGSDSAPGRGPLRHDRVKRTRHVRRPQVIGLVGAAPRGHDVDCASGGGSQRATCLEALGVGNSGDGNQRDARHRGNPLHLGSSKKASHR